MNDQQRETEEVAIRLTKSILKQIDRIAVEKETTRDKVINDLLANHFSVDEDWLDDLIQ